MTIANCYLASMIHSLINRLLHAIFMCRQLVDLAVPFSIVISGLGGTFWEKPGGLGGTFSKAIISSFQLHSIALTLDRVYAKVLFTNLIETKAGLSPDCFYKNFSKKKGESSCLQPGWLALQRKFTSKIVVILRASGEKSLSARCLIVLGLISETGEDLFQCCFVRCMRVLTTTRIGNFLH